MLSSNKEIGVLKMSELKQVFTTPDGKTFEKKADALNYLRKPKIHAAMVIATDNQEELATWLVEHQEVVEIAFETGTIKRVTKSEFNKLNKALEALQTVDEPKISFLQDNAEAIAASFRWPSVKRMTDEEKTVAAVNVLAEASEGNNDLATWVVANKEAVLEAYKAGVVKRKVSPKATEALAAYRAKKAAEKAAKMEPHEAAV
jgi:dsDNA-binding SOS-regulon protein